MIEHPGTILKQRMTERQYSLCGMSRVSRMSVANLWRILHEERGYSAQVSLKLDKLFGDKPGTWWRIWTTYQLEKAMQLTA